MKLARSASRLTLEVRHGAVLPGLWGGAGNGETCDACEELISRAQYVLGDVSTATEGQRVQFHVACFHLWDEERCFATRMNQVEASA